MGVSAVQRELDEMVFSHYRLEVGFHRQHEWAIAPMWWEMSAGGIGPALFVAGAVLGSWPAAVAGMVLTLVVKGLLLLVDLGRPERVWRVFSRPRTSWIARGSWAFAIFGAGSLIWAVADLVGSGSALGVIALVVATAAAAVLVMYDGLFLGRSAGVSGWRSGALPLFFAGGSVGAGSLMCAALLTDDAPTGLVWAAAAGLGLGIVSAYAYLTDIGHGTPSARIAARDLTSGEQRALFLGVGIAIGVVVPVVGVSLALVGLDLTPVGWWALAACAVAGVYAQRRSVLRAGTYAPMI